jgi:murein DD-endopeptidase MepM/ murein hydrolase activator NlpD
VKHLAPLCILILLLAASPGVAQARQPADSGVQAFLDTQPGPLAAYVENERSAATIIESAAFYYGLSPRLHLALLEATSSLISDPAAPASAIQRPFGAVGPLGFAAQIDWASRELRAGLGPYSRPPTLRFSDGVTLTLTLDQAPEGVAVQRLLARGRTEPAWRAAVQRFGDAFARYFNNELVQIGDGGLGSQPPSSPSQPAAPAQPSDFTLLQPWPAGERVVHLAYFDHVYPTVDSGDDGNDYVVTYTGGGNVQYDGHDGHDYYFPDRAIGTPILAAADGMAYARTHRGLGVVIVHPGGYETVYWHLDGFAPLFADLIDSNQGVFVRAGTFIGTSGRSGFVRGTPHLHFEVRRFGRQVDPYGWYGPGPDPCGAYAGCLPGPWLWDVSLRGTYDFTPPDLVAASDASSAPAASTRQTRDDTPPVGTFSVEPPADLLFAVDFDGHPVQRVGRGFPALSGTQRYEEGRSGKSLRLDAAAVTYPVAGNLSAGAGTLSLWVQLPERYPQGRIPRHYLFAASASPDGAPVYSGTLALRRDLEGPDGSPAWVFWTTAEDETSRDLLAVPDTLGPGWHHFALTWDAETGSKALYIDGVVRGEAAGIALPQRLGEVMQLGRFTYGGGHSNALLDALAVFNRPLTPAEIAALAAAPSAMGEAVPLLTNPLVRVDTNAIDDQGGIVAVQLGLNGQFEDPQPYYDAYSWLLPATSGRHELAVRYTDRAGNTVTVTQMIELDLRARVHLPFLGR